MKAATIIASAALAVALASAGLSLHAVRVARNAEAHLAPAAAKVGAQWTAADESAVAVLLTKSGQQLGGYLASLKRGNQRHSYTEAQLLEAIRRQRIASDVKAASNLWQRVAQ